MSVSQEVYGRAVGLLEQLQRDLEAIASAPPNSSERNRAITKYSSTFAALGRIKQLLQAELDALLNW